jgi:hypothetical protein
LQGNPYPLHIIAKSAAAWLGKQHDLGVASLRANYGG